MWFQTESGILVNLEHARSIAIIPAPQEEGFWAIAIFGDGKKSLLCKRDTESEATAFLQRLAQALGAIEG